MRYIIKQYEFTYSEAKEVVNFIRSQGASNVRQYCKDRMSELGMSMEDTLQDLYHSAIDLMIDREQKEEPECGIPHHQLGADGLAMTGYY